MDDKQKLLHFQGHTLGLKKTGPDTYEVINTPFLEQIVQDYSQKQAHKSIKEEEKKKKRTYPEILINKILKKYKPRTGQPKNHYDTGERAIRSFSLVATQEIKEEAAVLIKSLRLFHDEPVMILCDEATRNYIEAEKFTNIDYVSSANPLDLERARSEIGSRFDDIKTFHRTDCIYKKMECLETAINKYGNTLFLDADIVVVDSLQEDFSEDIVLSPHYHIPDRSHMTSFCGIFNAGYIYCADKTFPDFWKNLYLNDSTFYEQEGMNYIAETYDIDFFHKGHNIGFWRDVSESVESPLELEIDKGGAEKAKSFHVHMLNCIDFGDNKVVAKKNSEMKRFVMQYLKRKRHNELYNYILSKTKRIKKTAFVHFGKCAGVYVNKYIRRNVLTDAFYYNTWEENNPIWQNIYGGNLRRDWTETELNQIAKGEFNTNIIPVREYQFAHNHHNSWSENSIRTFKDNNWFTFMFLRNPKDLICSLYFFGKKLLAKENGSTPIGPEGALAGHLPPNSFEPVDVYNLTLDEFFERMIIDSNQHIFWKLPDYIDELDYVAEFNDKNFAYFLEKYYDHPYLKQKKENVSANKGFDFYYQNGKISQKNKEKIESDPDYKKYFNYLDQV